MPPKKDDKAVEDPDVGDAAVPDGDDNHEEATEILSDLLRNQAAAGAAGMGPSPQPSASATEPPAGSNSTEGTQVGEAQQAAMQQMMSQLAMQGVNVQAIDASSLVAAAASPSGKAGDKKHAFWDTQVSYSWITPTCSL